jgi:hypothetical protein
MDAKLQTRNVFLDTQVFVAETYFVGTKKLTALSKLAADGKIRLLMSAVTIAECKNRIQKMVAEAGQVLSEHKRKLAILRNATSLDISCLAELDKATAVKEITEKFEAFLRDARVTICPLAGVSIERLFSDYALGNPPFGENQKKDQFPDAAAMLSLGMWCDSESQTTYVISEDRDIESVCKANPKFIYKARVVEFLDIFNKHEIILGGIVTQILSAKGDAIKEQVRTHFEASGFFIRGEIADVENVEVSEIEVEKAYIISVHDDYAIAEVEISIAYSADVSYRDYSKGQGDSTTWEFSHVSIENTQHLSADVEIEFDKNAPGDAKVTVSLGPGDIQVPFSSEDPNHWK